MLFTEILRVRDKPQQPGNGKIHDVHLCATHKAITSACPYETSEVRSGEM